MVYASLKKTPSDNNSIRKLDSKHTIELTTQTVQVDLFKDVAEKVKEETKDELTQREKTFVIWTLVQVICLIYNIIFTPIQICYFRYKLGVDNLVVMHICDYVVDFLCAVDIYFRIYPIFVDTAAATTTTSNTNEPNKLLRYKDRFSFVIDVFATIPFELIGLLFNIEGDFSFALLRLNRLLRLFRLKRYDIADFLKDGETIDISFERMFYLFSLMFLCAHYFGCLFYFSALYVARTFPNTQTWPEVDGLWKIQYQYIDEDTNISSNTMNITLSEDATRYSNIDECIGGYMSTHITLNYNGNSNYDESNPLILCFLVNF